MSAATTLRSGAAVRARLVFHPLWGFRSWAWVTVTCVAITGAVFVGVALGQWRDYQNNAFDLAIFDQLLWNTAQGDVFKSSFVPYGQYMGQHFSPVLFVLVPFYWLGAGAVFLTVLQGVVAAAAAVPLYFAARRWVRSEALAAALAGAYLLNPYLHRAVAFDFHPETMVALPAFACAWAASERRFNLAFALGASVLLFKDDSAYVAVALAALIGWSGGRRQGLALAVLAVASFLAVNFAVMPLLRGGYEGDYVPRYDALAPGARTVPDLVLGLATHPWRLLVELGRPGVLWTMSLFVLSAPLMLARPAWLLALIPGVWLAVLSSHPPQHSLELHYAAQLAPLAVIGAMLGAGALRDRVDQRLLSAAAVVPAVIAFAALSPISPFHDRPGRPTDEHRAALTEAVAIVPSHVRVSAQTSIVPRLAHRRTVKEFPGGVSNAEWVVIDRYGALSGISVEWGYWPILDYVREQWDLVFDRDGVQVFRRHD
ncbi:MAG TPA: DUF2079 domain-containing protein [Tepidiformaceae bacterium]|nr:DUF2079 domain-containing protein [Tepidiformaceae bacterium]